MKMIHSSSKLQCSTKCSCETLQKPNFIHMKTQSCILSFSYHTALCIFAIIWPINFSLIVNFIWIHSSQFLGLYLMNSSSRHLKIYHTILPFFILVCYFMPCNRHRLWKVSCSQNKLNFFCGTPYMSNTNSILIFLQKKLGIKSKCCQFLLVKPEIIMNLLIKTDKINFWYPTFFEEKLS